VEGFATSLINFYPLNMAKFYSKQILITISFILTAVVCKSQENKNHKITFYSEILPYLYFPEQGAGDGFQIGVARAFKNNKYKLQISYGSNKYSYKLSGDFKIDVGGVPQFFKKTDESIFTPDEERGIEYVPDLSIYESMEKKGIIHFKPDDGAYSSNYLTVELMKNQNLNQLWKLDWGVGGQIGLMNITRNVGGVISPLYYPLSGNYVPTQVTFRFSAKYMYYSFTNRLTLYRKITDKFGLGVSAGTHIIMGKHEIDMIKPYLGIMANFEIN
jgi:hypothetical protein